MLELIFATIDNYVTWVTSFLWGGDWQGTQVLLLPPMVVLLLGAGLLFMVLTGFRPLWRLGAGIKHLFTREEGAESGALAPWKALSTALSGQVGTGNLAGVATAIALGGPGAIFWMWITALVGMAAAFAESTLAVKYREKDAEGNYFGGPMYYIRNGLGKNWAWLATLFALATIICGFVTGNMVQANSLASGVASAANEVGITLPTWGAGVVIALFTFVVIIGGIKSIGEVAGAVVPIMALGYIVCAAIILVLNWDHVPDAFALIFSSAFGLEQAAGGVVGYTILQAVRAGVARGLFSNEAGQGSTPIAHASAITNRPTRQGEIAMVGVFVDTILICTMTALVILTVEGNFGSDGAAYAWQSMDLKALAVAQAAFEQGLPFAGGHWIVTIALVFFAFTTIIGWSYYGEQALAYLTGHNHFAVPYRVLWVLVVVVGATLQVDFVWTLGDLGNAMMAIPNLIGLLLLTGTLLAIVRNEDQERRAAARRALEAKE
jgi:AGCS family alanine or glycine:cation symporter